MKVEQKHGSDVNVLLDITCLFVYGSQDKMKFNAFEEKRRNIQDSKYTSGDIVLYATIFQVLYPCRVYKRHHSDGQPRREFRLSPLKKTCRVAAFHWVPSAGYFRASSPYDTTDRKLRLILLR